MIWFIVGFPKANSLVVFVGVDDVLDVGPEPAPIFGVMLPDTFAGRNEPAAVVDAENWRGILVLRREDVGIRLFPAIVEEDKFRLDAVLVGAGQKILDFIQQYRLLLQIDVKMQVNADAVDAVNRGVMQ